jgi:hypothetical protein
MSNINLTMVRICEKGIILLLTWGLEDLLCYRSLKHMYAQFMRATVKKKIKIVK